MWTVWEVTDVLGSKEGSVHATRSNYNILNLASCFQILQHVVLEANCFQRTVCELIKELVVFLARRVLESKF